MIFGNGNGEAEGSSDESSVAREWSLTWGDQAEPSERCKQGHLRVPLLNERFSKCQNNCGGDHKLYLVYHPLSSRQSEN